MELCSQDISNQRRFIYCWKLCLLGYPATTYPDACAEIRSITDNLSLCEAIKLHNVLIWRQPLSNHPLSDVWRKVIFIVTYFCPNLQTSRRRSDIWVPTAVYTLGCFPFRIDIVFPASMCIFYFDGEFFPEASNQRKEFQHIRTDRARYSVLNTIRSGALFL